MDAALRFPVDIVDSIVAESLRAAACQTCRWWRNRAWETGQKISRSQCRKVIQSLSAPSATTRVAPSRESRPLHRSRIVYHLSLEDAVMKRFSGEWVVGVVRSLEMTEGTSITSRLVARRIRSTTAVAREFVHESSCIPVDPSGWMSLLAREAPERVRRADDGRTHVRASCRRK
jgi:hypothetical protein